MRRFLLLMIAASCALRATQFLSVTCTLGTVTEASSSSCLIGSPNPTPEFPGVGAGVSASLMSGGVAFAFAIAPPGIRASASAFGSDSEALVTEGPKRLGLLQFDVTFLPTHVPFIGDIVDITDGVHHYPRDVQPVPGCNNGFCEFIGTEPFYLGLPYGESQASIALRAAAAPCSGGCPDIRVDLNWELEEADGTPVEFSTTPEPSTCGLLLFGLAGCCLTAIRATQRRISDLCATPGALKGGVTLLKHKNLELTVR